MKKFLIYLLLLISIAGTFCPCCMDDDCAEETTHQESTSHQSHTDKGPCSPLFACNSCAASVDLTVGGVVLSEAPAVSITHQPFYLARLGSYSASLFQPPRSC